jgi:enamine deaminase RidA (YjgF/YER057c/UK114 family)
MRNCPLSIRSRIVTAAIALLVTGLPSSVQAVKAKHTIGVREADGCSDAVRVADVALVHTRQFLPQDGPSRAGTNGSSARVQIDAVLAQLKRPELKDIVKLHVVAASDDVVAEVRKALVTWCMNNATRPAVSYVIGKLRNPDALVAIDAVAMSLWERSESVTFKRGSRDDSADLATLPPGPKVYVSGQAEKGKDIAEMTRRTMESLMATLKHLGLEPEDVVQVKSFLGPIAAADEAEREITKFFSTTPPLVFVEWTTAPAIEIELIASGNRAKVEMDDTVEFITPPGMTASPVFSRVARMAAGPTIYISGLYGTSNRNGAAETGEIFDQLGKLLEKTGSDFRHLVKATYYVSTDDANTKLNELRPKYYDPKCPPAASKAPVTGTGLEGKSLTLDMIAAPRAKAK